MVSDRLAKAFDRHLSDVAGNDNLLRARLRARGWKDFVDHDRPETDDPIEMGVAAIKCIGFDSNECWCCEMAIIVGVFAFLESETGLRTNDIHQTTMAVLKSLLDEQPVDIQ